MSLFDSITASCPVCGKSAEHEIVVSVNAGRRPDLREAILDGTFQEVACPACAALFRLPPRFTYIDLERGQWLLAYPIDEVDQWTAREAAAELVFASTFGSRTLAGLDAIAAGMSRRVVFGWPALQEKLICADLGLDDVFVELLKISIIASAEGAAFADTTELRLRAGDATHLTFAWLDTRTEGDIENLTIPRTAYDEVLAAGDAWSVQRDQLREGMFVDLQRLLVMAA